MWTMNVAGISLVIFTLLSDIPTNTAATIEKSPGQPLIDVGKFFNKPHVELTGKVINNLARKVDSDIAKVYSDIAKEDKELDSQIVDVAKDIRSEMADVAKEICRLHPCTEWGEWKQCIYTPVKGYHHYGKQSRTRNCGFNTTLCKRYSADKNIEHEFRTCNTCHESYTVTEHGYCIKFVNKNYNRNSAISSCKADGAQLIQIDSKIEFEDVCAFAKKININARFWIDGYRAAANSEWKFENKPKNPPYMRWYSSRPVNDLYLILLYVGNGNARQWYMYDVNPGTGRPFICEVYS